VPKPVPPNLFRVRFGSQAHITVQPATRVFVITGQGDSGRQAIQNGGKYYVT